jgi:hypothetical protein
VQSIILDTLKLKNDGSTDRNTSRESLLLDRTEENNIVESRIRDITQPFVNKQPVSTVQKSKHPEVFNSVHIRFINEKKILKYLPSVTDKY